MITPTTVNNEIHREKPRASAHPHGPVFPKTNNEPR